jgi:PAS domain S-box-containing protein
VPAPAAPAASAKRNTLLVVLAAAALFALYAWVISGLLLRTEWRQVARDAAASIVALQQQQQARIDFQIANLAQRRARFISDLQAIPGIGRALLNNGLDPVDRNTLAQWRTRLEQTAQAYIANFPDLYQISLIGVADGGRELLRVVQDQAGKMTIAAQADLQRKGDRPYFQKALRLPEGEVHVSPIDLNVENERIEVPHRPTLRAAMPVRNAKGEVFAVVVVNVLAQQFLGPLTAPYNKDFTAWVTDGAGHYLVHPQPGKAFAHLLNGPGATWQQEFTPAPGSETVALDSALPAGFSQATLRAPDGAHWLIFTRTLRAPEADGTGGVVLHSGIPLQVLAARAWQGARGQVMLVWAMGLLVIGLLAFMLLRWRGTPLGLTVQTESATPGRTLRIFGVELPLTATGRLPLWQVVAAALLPLAWWALLTVLLVQPVKFPFILMLLPVLLASWWGGLYAGLAATVLAVVGAWDLGTDSPFLNWTSHGDEPGIVLSALTLLVTGLLVTFSQEAIRRRGALLGAANARLARTAQAAQVGFGEIDYATGKVSWSAEMLAFRGLREGEFDGTLESVQRFTHPDDRERLVAVVRDTRAGEQFIIEFRVLRPDGQIRWLEARGVLEADASGQLVRFVGTEVDITERKAAQTDLQRTRDVLEQAQQVAQLGSFEYFPRTNTLEWSAEEKRIHGLDPDGPSPSFEAVVALMLPEDRAPTLALFEQFMRGDGAGAWDYRIVLPDGSLRHMSTRA